MAVHDEELGGCLKAWRGRVSPHDAGLAAGTQRRVPGLRREEVAQLAGVSLDYLARLEQGRATNPSASVLGSLARALRLSELERAHLFRLAGHAEPSAGTINRHVPPGVQRLLDRLADVPVMVFDATTQLLAANDLAQALTGDLTSAPERERNIAWRHFTGCPTLVVRTDEERGDMDAQMVGDLREAVGRYPDDARLAELIDDLLEASPVFAELWNAHPVSRQVSSRKTFMHPEVGPITLDCDVLVVQGSDLRVIIYTPVAGSRDADTLALVSAIGLQSFSASRTPRIAAPR
jgi:transcriptional regulator with XRE-family HTH domain